MEQNFQTSFIPKKPIVKETVVSARPVSIFLIVALFVLFFVLLVSGGLYFYKGIVTKQIGDMQKNLELAKNRFEPAKIAELQILDKRLRASSDVLSKHVAVSPVFDALENLTMKTVRFTKFDYSLDGDKVKVKMSGVAIGYRSIALQSDLFAKNKNIIDPIFSNLTLDNSGNVVFDLDFSVDPSFVNYKQMLLTQDQTNLN
ncbi:hypothetical protein IT399_02345 [Candidatus Nomurabacteria bacterium]|nr:hypothetical protein [Candidatus Nomurabacteria bacterium]